MCLSAIIWANIDKVYYGRNLKDAEKIGFRDDFIYDFIKNEKNSDILSLIPLDREDAYRCTRNTAAPKDSCTDLRL